MKMLRPYHFYGGTKMPDIILKLPISMFFALFLSLIVIMLMAISLTHANIVDENDAYIATEPERTMEEIEKAYAEMPEVKYQPNDDRWNNLSSTKKKLSEGGDFRIVMLGDSIVNDTSRSRWEDLLQQKYPKSKIVKVTCVRGSTGCWWYKEADRVKRYVLDYNPDLLIIGGISHNNDTESIKDVIQQVRTKSNCDILLMTGAFGNMNPMDDNVWKFDIDPNSDDYRSRLQRLAKDEHTGFLDMTAHWGKYIRESGKSLDWFKRDPIHANIYGEQVLGHILVTYFAPKSN